MLRDKIKTKTFSVLQKLYADGKMLRMMEAKDKETEVISFIILEQNK